LVIWSKLQVACKFTTFIKREKLRTEYNILITSVILGLLAGVIDTIIDFLFFYPGRSFWELLISDVPQQEIYTRFLIFVSFVLFGFICGEIIARLKKVQEEKTKLINSLQQTLKEIKTLQGIIPICASCKNIRDDQGFWNKVESYLKKHSDVTFSHGICPDCAKKLYPELVEQGD
jgi:hypothetical protein